VPLAEIAPQIEVPRRGPVADLLARVDTTGIIKIKENEAS
jgi:7,8-dihydro-6-hydroxymethylpterin-pyrophosphokinase